MKIMFVPDYRKGNSYQENLADSLSKQDVSIYFSPEFDPKKITSLFAMMKVVIKCWKPDILHIHWADSFMTTNNKFMTFVKSTGFICELLLLKLLGIKIIWTVHNIISHDYKDRYQFLCTKFLARLADRLISHCPSASNEIMETYGKNLPITIIPHGNYIDRYKNNMTYSQARDKLMFDEKDVVFLHFGYVRPYKGVLELINTFKRLNNQRARLLVVGKPFDSRIADEVRDNCNDDDRIRSILEFIPDNDIQIYMNAADIVVLPYKNILTSGTAVLSMSFGKPIIAPAIGCMTDTVDEKGGFLYTGDNLLNVMQHALEVDKESLANMGRHNFELAKQFSWDEIAKRTYYTYKECINR